MVKRVGAIAHAHSCTKHFAPETKSKVGPKKKIRPQRRLWAWPTGLARSQYITCCTRATPNPRLASYPYRLSNSNSRNMHLCMHYFVMQHCYMQLTHLGVWPAVHATVSITLVIQLAHTQNKKITTKTELGA